MAKKKKKLSVRHVASALCLAEGGKSQTKIGDMRQHVHNVSVLLATYPEIAFVLQANGFRIISRQPKQAVKRALVKSQKGVTKMAKKAKKKTKKSSKKAK